VAVQHLQELLLLVAKGLSTQVAVALRVLAQILLLLVATVALASSSSVTQYDKRIKTWHIMQK
jgi:hypothetical protein